MKRLKCKDIFVLAFLIISLFIGAGNIILPPMIGFQFNKYIWISAVGFLITAVGLPVITVIALARFNGDIEKLSLSIGKKAGFIFSIVCYLTVGPLFVIPRTAIISFISSTDIFLGVNELTMLVYSTIYFLLVFCISLYPGYLLNIINYIISPLKIISLVILNISVILQPSSKIKFISNFYDCSPFFNGFVNGYLTMDTLGAMIFSTIIINAIRSRGISNKHLLIRYTILASIIAGIGLSIIYLMLFILGSYSIELAPAAKSGYEILYIYIHHIFGDNCRFFFIFFIILSCLLTAVGLTCTCANFFSKKIGIDYNKLVFIINLLSLVISNLGINNLMNIFKPILITIYPPCIVLILLSFTLYKWSMGFKLIMPVVLVSLIFGCIDGINMSIFYHIIPDWIKLFPLNSQGLTWFPLTVFIFIILVIYYYFCKEQ